MWEGYEGALAAYGLAVCAEWLSRGYKDTCTEKIQALAGFPADSAVTITLPSWLGDDAFHRAHKSNLLRKDPVHYGAFFVDVSDDLPYVWPARRGGA
jgi:hypothetical protein